MENQLASFMAALKLPPGLRKSSFNSPPEINIPDSEGLATSVPSEEVTIPDSEALTTVSSRYKHGTPPVASNALGSSTIGAVPQGAEQPDYYGAKKADLDAQQHAQLAKAMSEENLTSEEKIAMTLLATLPGLLGGLAGGAIAGGPGAAAGVAGGLKGGAEGVQAIAADKSSSRKEALGRAKDLQDRIDHVDDQIQANREKMAERGFTAGEHEKARKEEEKLLADKEKFEAQQKALDRKHDFGKEAMAGKMKMDQIKAEGLIDLEKAGMANRSSAKNVPGDKEFYTNASSVMSNLTSLEAIVKDKGNYEGALGNPEARAKLGQLAYDTAVAYAKAIDPATAAREGEVESAKKYAIPMGAFEQNGTTLAAIANMRKLIAQKAGARQDYSNGVPLELDGGGNPAANAAPDPWSQMKRVQ